MRLTKNQKPSEYNRTPSEKITANPSNYCKRRVVNNKKNTLRININMLKSGGSTQGRIHNLHLRKARRESDEELQHEPSAQSALRHASEHQDMRPRVQTTRQHFPSGLSWAMSAHFRFYCHYYYCFANITTIIACTLLAILIAPKKI